MGDIVKLLFCVDETICDPVDASITFPSTVTLKSALTRIHNKLSLQPPLEELMIVSSLGRPLDETATLGELNFDFDKEKLAVILKIDQAEQFPDDVVKFIPATTPGVPHWDEFRKTYHVNEMDATHVYHMIKKGTTEYLGTKDKAGRPIQISNVLSYKSLGATFEETLIAACYMHDYMCKNNMQKPEITVILDLQHFGISSYRPSEANVWNFISLVMGTKKKVAKMYCVNASWIFRSAFKLAKKFLSQEVIDMMAVIGNPADGVLDEVIDRKNLPERWGGGVPESYFEEWADKHLASQGFTLADVGTKPFPGGRPFMQDILVNMCVVEDAGDMTYAAQSAIAQHSGKLTKQGYTVKNWKTFFFLLVSSKMYYYKNVTDMTPAGRIDLAKASQIIDYPDSGRFDIVCSYRTFCIKTDSEEDKTTWMDLINAIISGSDNIKKEVEEAEEDGYNSSDSD